MKEELYISLIYKEIEGTISDAEQEQLKDWLAAAPENQETADVVRLAWDSSGKIEFALPKLDLEEAYAKLDEKINPVISIKPKAKTRRLSPLWWAAACVGFLGIAYSAFFLMGAGEEAELLVMAEVIAKDKQVLTLSDSTKVTLKEGSSFKYAESFGKKERRVELIGEAFFEVTKDADRPFVIYTPAARVKVLGTAFNLKDDKGGDKTEVSVIEGKVSLKARVSNKVMVMNKSEKGILYHVNNGLQKLDSTDNDHVWRTGVLTYNDVPLMMALRELGGRYNTKFHVENAKLFDCRFSSKVKLGSLSNLNKLLESIYKVKIVQLEDGSYLLKAGRCR